VATRRSVWSDDAVQALAARFVPVAEEVGRLQRDQDADCRFFQGFCEQGHYGGRTKPSTTRQGIYAVTATGAFLASVNTRDAGEVAAMLRKALTKFAAMPPAERSGHAPALDPAAIARFERLFPADGLVLAVYSRDVARTKVTPGWRGTAWNQDHAWFRRDEVLAFVPEARVGARAAMPAPLLQRFVRAHFVDNVRGQTFAHKPENVVAAALMATCDAVDGDRQRLVFEGRVRIERTGTWATRGYGPASPQQLGYDCTLLGAAEFDRARGAFTAFRLLAIGTRRGATEFNGRQDDFGPAPLGIAFELAAEGAAPVAPSLHHVYEWQ
jgi:hypothetical protein